MKQSMADEPAVRGRVSTGYWLVLGVMVCASGLAQNTASLPLRGKAERVVVVVWDGMRPDLISPEHTPTLHRLAQQGVAFQNHHAVYLSSTEVNATAIATGMLPEHSGIIANKEYRPQIDAFKPVAMEDEATVRLGDQVYEGHLIAVPTLAEIIQSGGFRTAVAGTKAATILFDRAGDRPAGAAHESVDFCKGLALPPEAIMALEKANYHQPFPTNVTYPNVAQDTWTTRALTCGLWDKEVPKFSVLWLSEPDYSQHDSGPGSPASLGALESADHNLALVLQALDEKGLRDKTDLFIVSDHGFSTVQRSVDVAETLTQAGFRAARTLKEPARGDVLVVTLSGSVALYVIGHDEATIRKLVTFLQSSDFAGVIFSRLQVDGTFPLEAGGINSTHAPDLMVAMRWSSEHNPFGVPGVFVADTLKKGAHASLSPFDMHNTLVTCGPDFRSGYNDLLPTGNTDLAPTILWILGMRAPQPMDGRILSEALIGLDATPPRVEQKTLEATAEGSSFRWRQYLRFSSVGHTPYFDEGNGGAIAK